MENTDHKCTKCGKDFSCIDEANDNYKDYCGDCYKEMIQERMDSYNPDWE